MILSRLGNSPNMFCSEFARRQQPYKLSATGQELGSSMLFSSRIGCWNTANAALDVVPHVPWHGLGLHGWEICRQPVNRRFLWHPVFTLARRLGRMPFWSWERRPTLWFWNSIKQHLRWPGCRTQNLTAWQTVAKSFYWSCRNLFFLLLDQAKSCRSWVTSSMWFHHLSTWILTGLQKAFWCFAAKLRMLQ